jgi:DNA-binding NarL/FixJ family response regulator
MTHTHGEHSWGVRQEGRSAILVDQHPLWLDQIEQVVRAEGIKVVAKATSPTAALERLEDSAPDLLVTEIRSAPGELDGLALIREARGRVPTLKVIVLSMYEDREHIDRALAAGADAYVLKTARSDDLMAAVRQQFRDAVFFAASHPAAGSSAPERNGDSPALTRREVQILQLVAEGHSNAALARMLWVTEPTVKFHLSNIYRKLDVSNRTEASRWAQRQGLLASPRVDDAEAVPG